MEKAGMRLPDDSADEPDELGGGSMEIETIMMAQSEDANRIDRVDLEKNIEAETKSENSLDHQVYSTFTKAEIVMMIIIVSFAGLVSPLSGAIYYPALPTLAKDLRVSNTLINLTITTYQIFQGLAPSVIGNMSDVYGRRPLFFFCFAIYTAANIGLALQTNYAALMILRCVQSSGSGATIALGSATVSDLVSRAERGKFIGYGFMMITLGPALGPVIGGVLTQFLGWRSVFWFLTILSGVILVLIVLVLPETCRNVVGNGSVPPQRWNHPLIGRHSKSHRLESASDSFPPKMRTRPNPLASLKLLMEREGGIILGVGAVTFAGYFAIITTLSNELAVRFKFNAWQVGLCYLPLGIGSLFSRFFCARLMDGNFARHAKKQGMTIKKNTLQDYEVLPLERIRLEICLPLVYVSAAVMVAYGWTMETKGPLAGILVCLFLFGLFFSGVSTVLNTLVVDTHKESPATAVGANNLTRCLVSAGATAAATPLIERIGLGWTAVLIAGIWLLLSPLLWLVLLNGQKWRQEDAAKTEEPATPTSPNIVQEK